MRFHLGKIPVYVQPAFFFATLILGGGLGDLRMMATWAAIVFVSVMLHELGHAAAGLALGLEPRIELHTMGGTTSWSSSRALSTAQRVTISLAGPCAGFLLAALVKWGLGPAFPQFEDSFVYRSLLYVNFGWGVLNLVPMLPLDGGNVMMHLLNAFTGGRGERPARIVSIVVVAACLGAAPLIPAIPYLPAIPFWWGAMLALIFAGYNWRGLQELNARERDARDAPDAPAR
jgi:Zn-dependent protease